MARHCNRQLLEFSSQIEFFGFEFNIKALKERQLKSKFLLILHIYSLPVKFKFHLRLFAKLECTAGRLV